jgi:hypothetical protein
MSLEATLALIGSGCAIVGVIMSLVSQAQKSVKEGIEKGRLLQRIDEMERQMGLITRRVDDVEERHSGVSGTLIEIRGAIGYLREKMDSMSNLMEKRTNFRESGGGNGN